MFAYCGNSPVSRIDSSGHSYINVNNRGFTSQFNILQETGGGGGAIFIIPSFTGLEYILTAIGSVATGINEWCEEQQKAIRDKLEKSLAEVTTPRQYKTGTENHHIAAKKAANAEAAAAILKEVLPDGVESSANIMPLKTSIHRRIHTELYYTAVNQMVIWAYDQADGDPYKQTENVLRVLGSVKTFLISLEALDPN